MSLLKGYGNVPFTSLDIRFSIPLRGYLPVPLNIGIGVGLESRTNSRASQSLLKDTKGQNLSNIR